MLRTVSTSYLLPTAAILNEISPPTFTPQSIKTEKETEIIKWIECRAEELLLKHTSPIFQAIHASCSVMCAGWRRSTARMQTRFPPFSSRYSAPASAFPPRRKHSLAYFILTPSSARRCGVRSPKPRNEQLGRWRPTELPEAGPLSLHGCGWP